jgi:hypothetical protein
VGHDGDGGWEEEEDFGCAGDEYRVSSRFRRFPRAFRILGAKTRRFRMWLHPITARQIRVLEGEWGVKRDGEHAQTGDDSASEGWFEVLRPVEVCLL